MTTAQHDTAWPALGTPVKARRGPWTKLARAAEPVRPRLGLAVLLGLTAVLYLWGLSRNGFANQFYAAAVQAGTESWKAFFFGSLDPANFITVDKPPASLWVMELSGRLFGFSTWSMLVPQALEGVAAVGLLYATLRRRFPASAALLAGGILAATPVAALLFRFNMPDALLVLLLVAAAYATTRAVESGRTGWLALAGALIGFAFLTKMFQAFLVVPALALVYLVAAPSPLRRRLCQLLVAGFALVAAAGWWVAIVALTPASDRPYIGGSTNNSILDLIWGYNGLGRISGGEGNPGGSFSGPTGFLRLFNQQMGGQISWLLPAALIALGAGLWTTRRAPRTDARRAALILWGGWLVVSGLVYSYAGGVIHSYYTITLGPPIAALVGIAAVSLWQRRERPAARLLLAAMLASTVWWSSVLLDRTPDWHPWLRWAVLVGGLSTAAVVALAGSRLPRNALVPLAAAGLLAGLAYTLSTVTATYGGSIVASGPASASGGPSGNAPSGNAPPGNAPPGSLSGRTAPPGGQAGAPTAPSGALTGPGGAPSGGGSSGVNKALVALLGKDAGDYTWILATSSSTSAAPIQLATGRAVMAIGGFTGSDPSLTLHRFKQLVAAGKIHYYHGSGGEAGGPGGQGRGVVSQITAWVTSNFKAATVGGTALYDLTQPTR